MPVRIKMLLLWRLGRHLAQLIELSVTGTKTPIVVVANKCSRFSVCKTLFSFTMEIKLENLLSVRGILGTRNLFIELTTIFSQVGRVVPRDVDVSSFVSAEEYKQFFSDFTAFDISLLDNYKDKWVLVPTPVNIYLGEVFSFYLTCTNDSIQEVMTNVHIRIDMQSGNRAIFLKEFNIETLDAKATIDTVLGHEIKEPFTHVYVF